MASESERSVQPSRLRFYVCLLEGKSSCTNGKQADDGEYKTTADMRQATINESKEGRAD